MAIQYRQLMARKAKMWWRRNGNRKGAKDGSGIEEMRNGWQRVSAKNRRALSRT
jgi:hypothetical protein